MSDIELVWFIFTDTLFSNLVFIISPELAAWAAPKLSALSHIYIYTACFFAVLFASIINYILGISCEKIFTSLTEENEGALRNRSSFKDFMKRYGYFLVLFSFVNVYSKFFAVAAGFSRFNFFVTIFMISIMKTLFYIYG